MLLKDCNFGNIKIGVGSITAQELFDLGEGAGWGSLLLQHRQVEVQSLQECLEAGGLLQNEGDRDQEEKAGGKGGVLIE